MSALRKAGVWLGLIEDEDDDAAYDDRETGQSRSDGGWGQRRDRVRRPEPDRRYDDYPDELALTVAGDDDEGEDRARGRPAERPRRRPESGEGATVRSITRDPSVSHLTRDNLALAPHPVPRDRPAPAPVPAPSPERVRRYQITTLHPTTYREARTIGEHFREGTPVIMNLTEMEESDARRLVDFGAGLAFGLRGSMERVTNRVFLLSPANVQVTAEDKAKIAEGGFFHHR
jgi:cell division inhibitor SepF